tara:strand:- start:28 stop:1515 length:1488 start_codon:yes stop_codon:yes gene_type:complete
MGQFKPMVKMETTEPSVILKLKKGGHVSNKKMQMDSIDKAGHKKMANGGAMGALAMNPALVGRPAVNAPVAAPGKPSMAARRQAMMAKKAMPSAMMAKDGGKADMAEDKAMVKNAMKQHDAQEHKGGKGTKLTLKHGGKMATGGVVDGQGGYKDGGIIKTKDQGGEFRNTKMHDGDKTNHSPANTKGVKLGNGGGYKTGGVAKANGGGYKKGGSAKKHFAKGGKVDSGAPIAMKQKPAAKPIRITELTGTYKKGGSVARKAMGGQLVEMPNMADAKYQDPAYIASGQANAGRMNTMLENARNNGVAPDFSNLGVGSMPQAGGEDIYSLYQSLLGRAPDPTGIAVNRGQSADTIRQSIMESPERKNRMAGIDQPIAVLQKRGGRVAHKQYGGMMSERDSAMMDEQNRAFNDHYNRLTEENLADSQAVDDALMYLPRKAMQGMDYLKEKFRGQGAVTDRERKEIEYMQEPHNFGQLMEQYNKQQAVPARRRGGAMKK